MECLPEIESDMSVFHRIEDIYVMNATTFLRRVNLLPAYDGAVRGAVQRMAKRTAESTPKQAPVATETDEEALWAAYRQRRYAKFLRPGEVPKKVSVAEGMALASQALRGVN